VNYAEIFCGILQNYQAKSVAPLKKPPTPSCLAPSTGFVTTPVTP